MDFGEITKDIVVSGLIVCDETQNGIKCLSEIGTTGSAAMGNPVHHAISKRIHDLPITPETNRQPKATDRHEASFGYGRVASRGGNLPKKHSVVRRSEGGEWWLGGPLWSPVGGRFLLNLS